MNLVCALTGQQRLVVEELNSFTQGRFGAAKQQLNISSFIKNINIVVVLGLLQVLRQIIFFHHHHHHSSATETHQRS